jgi:hypothetical protein
MTAADASAVAQLSGLTKLDMSRHAISFEASSALSLRDLKVNGAEVTNFGRWHLTRLTCLTLRGSSGAGHAHVLGPLFHCLR